MHSIRTKTTILNAIAVAVSATVITVISAVTIANLGHSKTEQALSLLCDSGKHALNSYFKSVEQSINTVSDIINNELSEIDDATFEADLHYCVEEARHIFRNVAENTSGVLTYYYRFDPSITHATGEKGFWYIDLDGQGFVEHEVTDLDDDQFESKWFYQTKASGKPLWLPPYFTDNLDVFVISYNVPVYRNEQFFGVVGIEVDYKTMGEQIKDIKVLKTGYAFIVDDEDGSIIYHPSIDILAIPEDQRPTVPVQLMEAFKSGEHHTEYVFEGVLKHSYWLPLSNGMNLVVAVPDSEVNETWLFPLLEIVLVGVGLMAAFIVASILFSRYITKPLKEITLAAKEINNGNYNVTLDYKGNDEIGVLTDTFNGLIKNLGEYINELNGLAYADALTSVANKSAFDIRVAELQKEIDEGNHRIEFAIAIMDTDELKNINDIYGHDKGDAYLTNSCSFMQRIFEHSIVYRIGGDEFAVILEGEDYANREALKERFVEKSAEICAFSKDPWERIRVSIGLATYDPDIDNSVNDVIVHADHLMYINKRHRKKH